MIYKHSWAAHGDSYTGLGLKYHEILDLLDIDCQHVCVSVGMCVCESVCVRVCCLLPPRNEGVGRHIPCLSLQKGLNDAVRLLVVPERNVAAVPVESVCVSVRVCMWCVCV
jgi:hypothetical protein